MERTSESASPAAGRPQGCTSNAGNTAAGDRLTGGLWRDAVSLCFLAIAAMIFFWPVVSGTAWLPKGGGDSVSYIFPMYRFAAESLRSGTIPFWNPYQYAGTPFLSDNQSGLFYPFNLLLFLVWPDFSYRAIEMLVIFHFLLAGAAMYCCLRFMQPEAPIRRPAALLGALAFMFSDVFITHIGNLNLIAVAAWLPLAFLGLHRAIGATSTSGRLKWAIAGGAALGAGALAGHGQMTFLSALFLGFYALYQLVVNRRIWALPLLIVSGGFAVALAGISLFPAAETLQHTLRAEFDYARSTNYALPIRGLTGLIAPDFFGRGTAFWGDWLRVESGYIGVVPLFLAAVALILRPNRQTGFFLLAAILFLLLALGPATPVYPLLARLLPALPFQVPARFVFLTDFCLAVLAAIGLDSLLTLAHPMPRLKRGLILTTGVTFVGLGIVLYLQRASLIQNEPERGEQMLRAVLIFAAQASAGWLLIVMSLRGRLSPFMLSTALIGLLFLDLYGLGSHVEIDWNDPTPGFAAGSQALEYLKSDGGIDRVDVIAGAWQPNMPMIERLYAARGVYNPLQLANYNVFMGSVGFRGSPAYNLMGIKYLIGGKKEPPGDTNFIVPIHDSDPSVTLYLNTLSLPRAMVLFNSHVVEDHDAAFQAIHDEAFDPAGTVILEGGQALAQEPGVGTVEVARYDLNEIAFNVSADRPAYLFLSDVYHPDWQATVDGDAAPIEIANYAFRAILLEPGNHVVAMRFVPSGWFAGVIATSVALVALMALILRSVWAQRKS